MEKTVELLNHYWRARKIGRDNKSKNVELRIDESMVDLTLKNLMLVAEHFGTTDINFNKYDVGGCPTCGPEWIWELEVFNITKNYPFEKG